MAVSAGTIEMLKELLGPLGVIGVRRMFGGAAIYCNGQVFALVGDDTVHFKVDDATRPDFEAEGCGPFTYAFKDGRTQHLTTYHRIPEWLLDEPDELLVWARKALAASRRGGTSTSPRPRPARSRRPRGGHGSAP